MKKNLLLLLGIILLNACTTTTDSNATKTTAVVPLVPSNLTGRANSTTEINLSWTDNSTNELGFKIERKTGLGSYSVIGTTTSNELIFNDSNLSPSTAYTYRVCSYNSTGNSLTYSNEITVTTNTPINKPVLTTTTPSSITKNSAICGGTISSDGGATITARGIVWNTSPNPTINNNKTVDGIGTGTFSSNLQNLTPLTTIYVRAYATNSAGTSYGNEVTITTLASLKIGDEYQGGIIYYIFSPDEWTDVGFYVPGEIHGLIVAKNDLPDKYEYGCYNKYFNTLGHSNLTVDYHSEYPTVEIFNYCGANTAAGGCYNLNLNGYSDWYLPTFQELRKIFYYNIIKPDGKVRWSCTWQNYYPDNSVPNTMDRYAYAYGGAGIGSYSGTYNRSELLFVRPVRKF